LAHDLQVPLQKPKRDPDGAWNFFDGALKTWFVQAEGSSFTSRQVFKHSNPHTGNGRKSTATREWNLPCFRNSIEGNLAGAAPYHWHIYQTERFDVVRRYVANFHQLLNSMDAVVRKAVYYVMTWMENWGS